MKPRSLFINASRGMVVDDVALREHILSGHIAGAALDVFPVEPKAQGDAFESVLRGLDNVILTPHVGGSTQEAQEEIGYFVAGKLAASSLEGSTALSVNLPAGPGARRSRRRLPARATCTSTSPACSPRSTRCSPTQGANVIGAVPRHPRRAGLRRHRRRRARSPTPRSTGSASMPHTLACAHLAGLSESRLAVGHDGARDAPPGTDPAVPDRARPARRGAVPARRRPGRRRSTATGSTHARAALVRAGSPITRVHGDASMFVGGIRALLLQTLHPAAMRAVSEHSGYRGDMWGRLARTSRFLAVTTFGTADDAQQAVDVGPRDPRPGHRHDARRHAVRRLRPAPARAGCTSPRSTASCARTSVYGRAAARPGRPRRVRRRRPPRSPAGSASSTRRRPRPSSPRRSRRSAPSCAAPRRPARRSRYLLFKPPLPLAARAPYGVLVAAAVGLMPRWTRPPLRLPWLPVTERTVVRGARRAGHRHDPLGDGARPRRRSARPRKPGDGRPRRAC